MELKIYLSRNTGIENGYESQNPKYSVTLIYI